MEISSKDIIDGINRKDDETIIALLNDYELTIGEIASLYETNYSRMNQKIKSFGIEISRAKGRKNSSFG